MDEVGFHGEGLVPDQVLAGNVEVKLLEIILDLTDGHEAAGFQIDLHGMSGIKDMEWSRRIVESDNLLWGSFSMLNMYR